MLIPVWIIDTLKSVEERPLRRTSACVSFLYAALTKKMEFEDEKREWVLLIFFCCCCSFFCLFCCCCFGSHCKSKGRPYFFIRLNDVISEACEATLMGKDLLLLSSDGLGFTEICAASQLQNENQRG